MQGSVSVFTAAFRRASRTARLWGALALAAMLGGAPVVLAAQSSRGVERTYRVPVDGTGLEVFLRRQSPAPPRPEATRAVLFVHGASFPSALAAGFRFDGYSWMDDLARRGFDVWALDFLGYGHSDRYPEMSGPAAANPPLGRADVTARQIHAAVERIVRETGATRVSLVAHSWGTIPAGLYAGLHPERVDRLVQFGPVTRREGEGWHAPEGAYTHISEKDQRDRFYGYVPEGEGPVLAERHFAVWGPAYMATDSTSGSRTPRSVRIPTGPLADLADAWSGRLPYDPARIRAPTLVIRGEWEEVTTDADARWLFDALETAAIRRDVKIGRGTHVMHLEEARFALYAEVAAFLEGGDTAGGHDHRGLTAPAP